MTFIFWGTGYEPRPHAPCHLLGHRYLKMEFLDILSDFLALEVR